MSGSTSFLHGTPGASSDFNHRHRNCFVFKLASDVSSLLDKFPAAWKPRLPGKLPGHQVEHVIETEGQPLYACWLFRPSEISHS